jgi:predicted lactoylglutathione lyase
MNNVAGIILLVDDIGGSVSFYKKLGFSVAKEVPQIATTVCLGDFWVELLHRTKVVTEEYKEDREKSAKGAGAYLQVQVEDVDAFYRSVISSGIDVPHEPQDYPWNQREFTVRDPDGYKLTFFTKSS